MRGQAKVRGRIGLSEDLTRLGSDVSQTDEFHPKEELLSSLKLFPGTILDHFDESDQTVMFHKYDILMGSQLFTVNEKTNKVGNY